jgi:uncharacterized protein GlcG (DUF336 family)
MDFTLENIDTMTSAELREFAKQLEAKFNDKTTDEKLKELIKKAVEAKKEPEKTNITVTLLRPHPHTVAGIRIDGSYTLTKEQTADEYVMKRLRKAEANGQIRISATEGA